MFLGQTSTDMQVHQFRMTKRVNESARTNAFASTDKTSVKRSSVIKRFATRVANTSSRRILAPQS